MSGDGGAELEIKLRLRRAAVAALLRHPALAAVKRGRMRTQKLRSTYFDTAALRLAGAGIGLRLRRDGRHWMQTVKGAADEQSGGGLAARPEYEWRIATSRGMPAIDTARLATTPWRRKLLKAAREGLVPMFTTALMRTTVPLAFPDSTMALLAVDVGEIRRASGGGRIGVCEIELELESGRVGNLFALARALAADIPLALEIASKAARGYGLIAPSPRRPVRADDARLVAKAPTAGALAAILRSCLRQIEGNADGLVTDNDPEWIHQMRIGTRRLRACLALMRGVAPPEPLVALLAEASWLAHVLGPARDLDVLAAETLPALAGALRTSGEAASAPALRSLRARVARLRKLARDNARGAVVSRRFVQFMLATGGFAATPGFGAVTGSDLAARLAEPARAFAKPLLKRRQHKLLRCGEHLPTAPPAERHVARLAAKKLRYATEFFASLYPKKKTRAYRKALARLQDTLGALNDASVAAEHARRIAGPDSPAAATLQGWAAAQSSLRAEELAAAWHHFTRTGPFWSDD